jgi:hypothetical protein
MQVKRSEFSSVANAKHLQLNNKHPFCSFFLASSGPVDRSQIRCEMSLEERMYLDMFGGNNSPDGSCLVALGFPWHLAVFSLFIFYRFRSE